MNMAASLASTTHVSVGLFTPTTLESESLGVKVPKSFIYLLLGDLFIECLLYQPCCQSLELRIIGTGPNCWLSEACVLVGGDGLPAVNCC